MFLFVLPTVQISQVAGYRAFMVNEAPTTGTGRFKTIGVDLVGCRPSSNSFIFSSEHCENGIADSLCPNPSLVPPKGDMKAVV